MKRLADTTKLNKFSDMKLDWLSQILLVLGMALAVSSQSYYSITAPGTIKPNRKYSVVVALLEANGPCSIRVAIEGPTLREFKDVNLQPFESQIIDFFPKRLQNGNYFLHAEGFTGLIFKNTSLLYADINECPKIYIQTNKAIYNPQDLVRFRFVMLDEHTRPLNVEDPISVDILDIQNNRIKQFKNISLTHGSFTGKFQLAKYPTLGPMFIRVKIGGVYDCYKTKAVSIFKYILPKFSVYLKTPSNIVLEDGNIKVAIYGKYTFGKYVEGKAIVHLWSNEKGLVLQTQHVDIQNLGFVDFKLNTINDIKEHHVVTIIASLTEKITGKTQSGKKSIYLQKYRYNLMVSNNEIEFENNKPYSIKVYVKHWTGAPVLDHKTPVTMQHGNKVYESFLDASGAATFEFDYDSNADYKFQYKDSKTELANIYTNENLMFSNREYYCRLNLLNKKIKLGRPVRIKVSSIVNIPYLIYTIMGHASLIHAEYLKVTPNQKSYIISITPSIDMIPLSFIYVHYVHKGHLRYGEMILNFPNVFENPISISAPNTVKPNEQVNITLNAQPKSYIGLLAVDLGVNMLDSTYDLNKQTILGDLYEEKSYAPVGPFLHPGITSGLVTLSNAHVILPTFHYLSPPSVKNDLIPHQVAVPYGGSIEPETSRIRENFPETWIFDNYEINETETKLSLQMPNTITTWRITAFSTNAVTGFGIINKPTDIISIQAFFISLDLPYSVKRGEVVTIPITIFNYSNQILDTQVVLQNNEKEFFFLMPNKQFLERANDDQQQIKYIRIAANKGETVKFFIFPIKAGEINLRITATCSSYSDAVWQKLKVEPEGVPKQQNLALYISIPEGEKLSSSFKLTDPVYSVPFSEYITFSVGGHYLVPTVNNFGDLTQMPTGSGEQNMINFAPSVLILQYLKVNGKLSKEKGLAESLQSSIEVAYQQQLSFRHFDGGYSVFGLEVDDGPSTWLTSYVVRYFIKASQFLDIDTQVIEEDLQYLASQQQSNGEFLFTGYLENPNHKNKYGLTAFILLAFLENQKYAFMYRKIIGNGIEFLNLNLNNVNDINSLSLIATVMKRTKHHSADILIGQLKSHGKENNGLRWWSKNDQNPASDVETTANVALALLDTPGDHTSILRWLIEQRNANGGFISCYATVAGMEALVKFSEKYTDIKNINLKISYSAKDELGNAVAADEFYVDSNNMLDFQKHELPRNTRHVTFAMEGSGSSLIQLTQQYNVNNEGEFRHFNIQTKKIVKNEKEYILQLCFSYVLQEDNLNEATNMIIIEVNLPSGFRSGAENIESLKQNYVKRVETKNSDTVVIFYLDKLKANAVYCLEIPVDKEYEIFITKSAAIVVYDYYNLSRSNTKFYSL